LCLCFDFQPRWTTHDTLRTTWTIVANDLEHGKYSYFLVSFFCSFG
jgi:hypothetical protein